MVVVCSPLPALSPDSVSLFYAVDDLLSSSPILVFYGASNTTSASAVNSRIQAHIFTPAGFESFPRLSISPASGLYAAVECLPRDEQGDDICRGLAFSLFKYFSELPACVREAWERQSTFAKLPNTPQLFSDAHAAILASRMVKVENIQDVIRDVSAALGEQSLSWLDLDIVLPPGTIASLGRESAVSEHELDITSMRYGEYAPLIKLFGESAFIPTSRLKRQPSKPTSLNRGTKFTRQQKENLRREMCEVLDTEESYVSKLHELLHTVAQDFREKAKNKNQNSSSPGQQALEGLFPPSLDKIYQVNTDFLEEMRKILEESENDAIQDIETTNEDGTKTTEGSSQENEDVTGVRALAAFLLAWFPKFDECYTSYMQAHSNFSSCLRVFMKDSGSSFSRRVQETGEQMLMSLLIEPVQRLPRYNLYIDNIVKQLPLRHPAIRPLLKARDIISEICSRDTSSTSQAKVVGQLKRIVRSWPQLCHPQGRLITALDVVELTPPFHPATQSHDSRPGVFLLFTDVLVFLSKSPHSAISARGLMAEIDNPSKFTAADGRPRTPIDLEYRNQMAIQDIEFTELHEGQVLQIFSNKPNASTSPNDATIRLFTLSGAYEGKASRWIEEMVKARVEGRFAEEVRESHSWEVRCTTGTGDLNLFSAVFEEGPERRSQKPAKIRIVINPEKGARSVTVGNEGVQIVANLVTCDGGFYRLETTGNIGDYATKDKVTTTELLPVLVKRLANILQIRSQIRNPQMSDVLVRHNQLILKSLAVRLAEQDSESGKQRAFRPTSPVKLLSNLFGGSVKEKDSSSRPRSVYQTPIALGEVPRMTPSTAPTKPVFERRPRSHDGIPKAPSTTHLEIRESIPKEEETLSSYILALNARRGNIVGRSIRSRANADELQVNELYNSMLEDPENHQIAAQASVDVLFAAFEKFLNIAWREKFGPLISPSVLDEIHTKANSGYPGEFEEHFRMIMAGMVPENQGALRALMNLLAELLEATGNDSDRGMLTHAFAEVLVPDGNPIDFISLLDRFVEDLGTLFGEAAVNEFATPGHSLMNSENQGRGSNSGSVTSNTSLRKRFGFGSLSRETGKGEHESKVGAVWRTLSKSGRSGSSESQPSSFSKGSLARTQSIDSPKRPASRERPTVLGAFAFEQPTQLTTIGENAVASPPRKKRRSSLSDLKILQTSATNSPAWNTPVKLDSTPQRVIRQSSHSPRSPSPTKASNIPTPTHTTLPRNAALRLSPARKENNSPIPGMPRPLNIKARPSLPRPEDHNGTPPLSTKRRAEVTSPTGIPSLKLASAGLSERPTAGNATKIPVVPGEKPAVTASPKRLRMQSPQKLRERMAAEQKAINAASSALQAELNKIGDEISAIPPLTRSPSKLNVISTGGATSTPGSAAGLSNRLNNISSLVTTQIAGLNQRVTTLSSDISSSLQVSEARCKKLDELYRDANAENEALYGRFNDELARVMKNVRSGDGVEELKKKLKESQEEAERLRRENMRLRREVGGLRAQLKE